jgi:cellobiose phosphorylase
MENVNRRLVRRDSRLIQLLDPPFDRTEEDPGYIRGYVPGVRENGGQYTHGAIWTAMAFAALGERERAWELTTLINPLNHARTKEEVATYKVEPYVIAADVYARAPHTGRGGWTWYTGSAGWMYRLVVEALLGVTIENGHLRIAPCIPAEWPGYTMRYRYRGTMYEITVEQSPPDTATGAQAVSVSLDGVPQRGDLVPLADDGQSHRVRVDIRAARKSAA